MGAEGPRGEPCEFVDPGPELEELHDLLDRLCVPSHGESAADRLIGLIASALGDRVKAVIHVEQGKALARHHLETCNHKEMCPCHPCRDARALR